MTVAELERTGLDAVDRRILVATQGGLPLVPRPYHAVAERLGLAPEEVMRRMQRLLDRGAIRRVAAVPNPYALGFRANGMSVWTTTPPTSSGSTARRVRLALLPAAARAARRPHNLFAMVHAPTRPRWPSGWRRSRSPRRCRTVLRHSAQHRDPEEVRCGWERRKCSESASSCARS
jgi:DNA-binding Lrp family transcriptional regulator